MICRASPKPPRWEGTRPSQALCSGPATSTLNFLRHLSQRLPRRSKPSDSPHWCQTPRLSLGFIPGHTRRPDETAGSKLSGQHHEITQTFPNDVSSLRAPRALVTPLLLTHFPEAYSPGTRGPAATHLPTVPGPTWCWRHGSSLTSRNGPSRGRVDTHGWKTGWGKFALTLPVLGPIWGKRKGIRVTCSHPSQLQTPGLTHPRAPVRSSGQQSCWTVSGASHRF